MIRRGACSCNKTSSIQRAIATALPYNNLQPGQLRSPRHRPYGSPLQSRGAHWPILHCAKLQQLQAAADAYAATQEPDRLLAEVMSQVQSQGGQSLSVEEQRDVNGKLAQLEEYGKKQTPRPLDSSDVWGNCNVAYSSTVNTTRQDREPAGGRFRGGLGGLLFQTKRLSQSLFRPDIAINKVEFALLGCIPGYVCLRGRLQPVGAGQDTAKISFDPPRVSLAGQLNLAIGPPDSVELATIYLTPQVRLGRGGRGSYFVFTKGGPSDKAGMETVGLEPTTPLGWAALLVLVTGLAAGIKALWQTSGLGWRAVAVLPAALIVFLTTAVARTLTSRPTVLQPQAA